MKFLFNRHGLILSPFDRKDWSTHDLRLQKWSGGCVGWRLELGVPLVSWQIFTERAAHHTDLYTVVSKFLFGKLDQTCSSSTCRLAQTDHNNVKA
jgi:hypothetical protein